MQFQQIQMVVKIKADSKLCPKSEKVIDSLKQLGLLQKIDQIIPADERELTSRGLELALKYNVESAPFFIVYCGQNAPFIYTSYARFRQEIFNQPVDQYEEISEMMDQYPELV